MNNLGSDLGRVVNTGVSYGRRGISLLENQWSNRLVQVSVFSAVVFWILGSYKLINQVDAMLTKTFSLKLGNDGTRALHAAIFGFFMYSLTRFILDPFVKQVAGARLIEGNAPEHGKEDGKEDRKEDGNHVG